MSVSRSVGQFCSVELVGNGNARERVISVTSILVCESPLPSSHMLVLTLTRASHRCYEEKRSNGYQRETQNNLRVVTE